MFCTSACALAGGGGDEGAAAAAFQYVNPRALITHRLSWTQIVSGEGLSARGGRKLERHVREPPALYETTSKHKLAGKARTA